MSLMRSSGGGGRAIEIEQLYRARYGRFLRVAVAVVRDEQLGEEAVHEGFVRALRHGGGFTGRGSLEAWLWRIVVNEARRVAAERQRVPVAPASVAEAAVAPSNGQSGRGALEALIAALPERQRLVLFLRYYADLDYDAIAEALGVRPGTVAATLHAAHSRLRRELLEVER